MRTFYFSKEFSDTNKKYLQRLETTVSTISPRKGWNDTKLNATEENRKGRRQVYPRRGNEKGVRSNGEFRQTIKVGEGPTSQRARDRFRRAASKLNTQMGRNDRRRLFVPPEQLPPAVSFAYSGKAPLSALCSSRPRNSAVCVNFKFARRGAPLSPSLERCSTRPPKSCIY